MKSGVMNKIKWFIVALLVILVAGMTMLGIFGFNNTVDYSQSYEIKVSIDIDIDEAKDILKTTTEDYFEEKGIKYVSYQFESDGMGIIYKLNTDYSAKLVTLEDDINTALNANANTNGVIAKMTSKILYEGKHLQVTKVLLAFGIGLVAIFVYLLFMNKLASAVAVIVSSVVSVIAFIALIALTRLPAFPFIEIMAVVSGVLGAILSVSTVSKYKEEIKNATEKVDVRNISDKVAKSELKKYLIALIVLAIAGVALIAFFLPYLMIMGGQIILAGVVSSTTAYFITPLIWSSIKGAKGKRI